MESFQQFSEPQPSMTWQELYPILVAVSTFQEDLANKKVRFNTDNSEVFHILRSLSSDKPQLMELVRPITLQCLTLNIMVDTQFVPTHKNMLADPLSCLFLQIFKQRVPQAEKYPQQVPAHLKFF